MLDCLHKALEQLHFMLLSTSCVAYLDSRVGGAGEHACFTLMRAYQGLQGTREYSVVMTGSMRTSAYCLGN